VLDLFTGSGTTAAVAAKWDRHAISVDVRESQIDLIKRRLNNCKGTLIGGSTRD